jgi:hypothetical protein
MVWDLSACYQTMIPVYTKHQIPLWLDRLEDVEQIASVELTSFSRLVRYDIRYKTDWAILSKPTPVYQFLHGRYNLMNILYDFPFVLRYIWPQHMAQQLLAVRRCPAAIQFVRPPDGEPLLEAVQQNGLMLRFGGNPTAEICLAAVSQAGLAIAYVPEKIRRQQIFAARWAEICDVAIAQDGLALQFVDPKTPERCRVAVSQNGWALNFCPEKTYELCWLAIRQNPATIWITTPEFRRILEEPPVRIAGQDIRRRKLREIPYRIMSRNVGLQERRDHKGNGHPGDQGLQDLLR